MVNIPAVLIANSTAVILMLIILLSQRKNIRFGFLDEKIFRLMIFMVILLGSMETVTFLFDGKQEPCIHVILLLLNSGLFLVNMIFSFLWVLYSDYKLFEDAERLKRIYPVLAIPALVIMAGCVINLFYPVFFRITQENIYQRTGLSILPFLVTFFYLFYGVGIIYFYHNKIQKYLLPPAVIFMIPILMGSLFQLLFYGISLIWLGAAVAIVSLYINVQNEASYIDVLSGLFNRQYLSNYLQVETKRNNSEKILAGIMLDIDHFKSINDQFGHLTGDEAITSAGKILHDAVSKDGFAVRYAGDEFIVIRRICKEQEILDTMEKIRRIEDKFNSLEKKPYQLHFSMGSCLYRQGEDTINSFLGRMDLGMYQEKKRKRNASR